MSEGLRSGATRYVSSRAVLAVALTVVSLGVLSVLLHEPEADNRGFHSPQELAGAYARVKPGARASQLSRFGFDSSAPNAQTLSYLGVLERFTARDTVAFDRLDGAVRYCIEARDRCTALVFKPVETKVRTAGMMSVFDLDSAKAATRIPEVTLLVQDGRVSYKMISGLAPSPARTPVARHAAAIAPTPIGLRGSIY